MLQSAVRLLMNMIAGWAITKGIGDASAWEAASGIAITAATLLWSRLHQKKMKSTAKEECVDPRPITTAKP